MRYTIGTGFWGGGGSGWLAQPEKKAEFFNRYWWPNTDIYAAPVQVVVVNAGSPTPDPLRGLWINCIANLGHVFTWAEQVKDLPEPRFLGAAHSILTPMAVAYSNQTDFIYKEQDCLAFGPWVETIYGEAQSQKKKLLLAHNAMENFLDVENSLFWCAWEYIPVFMTSYLQMSLEHTDVEMYPEEKLLKIMEADPENTGYYSFGFGRTRPAELPSDNVPWFIQQVTEQEIADLEAGGLL